MYRKLDRSGGRVLGYEVDGELSETEIESILEDVEATIRERGSVRLLVYYPEIPSPDPSALDEDVGFWLEHGDDVDRYAVVGDNDLVAWVTELEDRVTDADLRHFETGERDAAWRWLRETSE